MYEILNVPTTDILAVRISGMVDEAEYDRLVSGRLAARQRPSVLLVLENFVGWRGRGEDDVAPERTSGRIRNVAVVGKRGSWVWRMAAPFVDADVRYFEAERLADACAWLRTAH